MGWFDEQIKQRKQNDDEMMQEAIAGIVGAVMGKRVAVAAAADDRRARTAIGDRFCLQGYQAIHISTRKRESA